MSRSSQTDIEYIKRLKNCIQEDFYFYVKPENVLHVFHKYNSKLLTQIDLENISKLTDSNGSTQGAILLLDRLCLYPKFYDTLLKVLRDPMVKLEHVAEKMEEKKSQMDNEIKEEQRSHEEEVTKLRQEIKLYEQRICDLERQKEELYQMSQSQKCELAMRDMMYKNERSQLGAGRTEFEFDAFISHADEDEGFVIDTLLPELEHRGLKLCVSARDFQAGEYIPSSIVRAVCNSRRTVVVLTRAMLDSYWGSYEIPIANMESVHRGRRVLAFILKDDIPEGDLSVELLYNIRNNTCIPIPESLPDSHGHNLGRLWDKLAANIRN